MFWPIGAYNSYIEADANGAFLGGAFGYLTAHDWVRYGSLFLNDGLSPVEMQWASSHRMGLYLKAKHMTIPMMTIRCLTAAAERSRPETNSAREERRKTAKRALETPVLVGSCGVPVRVCLVPCFSIAAHCHYSKNKFMAFCLLCCV